MLGHHVGVDPFGASLRDVTTKRSVSLSFYTRTCVAGVGCVVGVPPVDLAERVPRGRRGEHTASVEPVWCRIKNCGALRSGAAARRFGRQ